MAKAKTPSSKDKETATKHSKNRGNSSTTKKALLPTIIIAIVILFVIGITKKIHRNYHVEEFLGESYFIIDSDYRGTYSQISIALNYDQISRIWAGGGEKEYRRTLVDTNAILSYSEYVDLLRELNLSSKQEYSNANSNYAVYLRITNSASSREIRLSDVEANKNSVVLYILDKEEHEEDGEEGWQLIYNQNCRREQEECDADWCYEMARKLYDVDILVVPVRKTVQRIYTVGLITQEDFDETKQEDFDPVLTKDKPPYVRIEYLDEE